MDLDELNLDIKIEVTSVQELREIREELQKIAKAKKEIDITEDEDDDPLGPGDFPDPKPDRNPDPIFPDYPKREPPYFICDTETAETGFETSTELTSEDIVDAADAVEAQGLTDEEFSTVGSMDEELFNDRSMR